MVTRQCISPKGLHRVRGNQGCSAGHVPSQSPTRPTSYSLDAKSISMGLREAPMKLP